jgi:hypothetical protein
VNASWCDQIFSKRSDLTVNFGGSRLRHGLVTPSCGLSFPSFGRVAFSELLRQVSSFWLQQVSSLWQLSLPSFGRRSSFSELLQQVFSFSLREFSSLWSRLQPEPAIPAWAVSVCDGGHGAATGCAQLLLPSAAQCLRGFGARPQGIPESF